MRVRFFKIFRADFEIGASRLVTDEMDSADRDMFRAAIHGDREAFEMIIRTMSRPLFAIAFGILQNREEAEDVVQDAFVKAWKSRWRVRELDEQLQEFAAAGNGSESPDDERHRQVRSALATLPELYRSAVALRYLQNMDYATIEQTLGLSNGALRGILGRALASMRKRLKPALAAMI